MKNIAYILSANSRAIHESFRYIERELCEYGKNVIIFFTSKDCEAINIFKDDNCNKVIINDNWNNNRNNICDEITDICVKFNIDYIFLSSGKLLSGKILDIYDNKILNTHPSLLPAFKGFNVQDKILNTCFRFMGMTTHFIDKNVDEGIIICQGIMPIDYGLDNIGKKKKWFELWCKTQITTIWLLLNDKITVENNKVIFKDVLYNSYINPIPNDSKIINYIIN